MSVILCQHLAMKGGSVSASSVCVGFFKSAFSKYTIWMHVVSAWKVFKELYSFLSYLPTNYAPSTTTFLLGK